LIVLQKDIVFSNERLMQKKIEFLTANPFSLFYIITDLENQENQNAYGNLRFPEPRIRNKYPKVLGVNGSKNWANHYLKYMDMYRKMGFATFEIQSFNSFNSRNVNSTVGDQTRVTTAMMILDSYKALEVLGTDKRIDIDNLAITG